MARYSDMGMVGGRALGSKSHDGLQRAHRLEVWHRNLGSPQPAILLYLRQFLGQLRVKHSRPLRPRALGLAVEGLRRAQSIPEGP